MFKTRFSMHHGVQIALTIVSFDVCNEKNTL